MKKISLYRWLPVVLFFFAVTNALALDTDHDALPDDWEIAHGRNPLVADYAISVGYSHACALDDTGVKCWGDNAGGKTTVPALQHPVAVSAGGSHTCVLEDRGVVCWGSDIYGQITVPVLSNPRMVSAGNGHTCALDDTGVHCWGAGTNSTPLPPPDYGQSFVPALTNPVMVSAGYQHTCAVDGGDVKCWGNNFWAQTTVPALSNPIWVSAGNNNSCALDDTGVHCWGYSGWGVTTVPALSSPVTVDVGDNHACALDGAGVHCWGLSMSGETDVPPLSNPTALSVGYDNTCALDNKGVHCWGDESVVNKVPELKIDPDGDGVNNSSDAFPLDATETLDTDLDGIGNNSDADDDGDTVPDVSDVFPLDPNEFVDTDSDAVGNNADNCVSVSNFNQRDDDYDGIGDVCDSDDDNDGVADISDNCPLDVNALQVDSDLDNSGDVCDAFPLDSTESADVDHDGVGDNADLDDDNDTLPDIWELAHGRNPLWADYSVSVGGMHSCALDDAGVRCWGFNAYGQTTVPMLVHPVAVSAGANHSCAIDDGGVKCWGSNSYGQTAVPELVNPVAISAGYNHTCALDNTGAHCWGGGLTNRSSYPDYGQSMVPALKHPVAIGVGNTHTCALDDEGVKCWGGNYYHQTDVPVLVKPVALSVAKNHTCAIDQGDVKCWGNGIDGQITVPTLAHPAMIGAGDERTCALDDTGVVCWGYNVGAFMSPLLNPVQISTGGNGTCALDKTGIVCLNDGYPLPIFVIDPDSDGLSNSQEIEVGSDVLDPDSDGDTVLDGADNCPVVVNLDQLNTDADNQGNVCDLDDDNDGVSDLSDALPVDPTESVDTDGDNLGDNADPFPSDGNLLNMLSFSRKNHNYGQSVAFAGDVNRDGYGDYVIGTPNYDIPVNDLPITRGHPVLNAGNAMVISGKNGAILMQITGSSRNEKMGFSVAGNGDIDHDGFDDVVVGAPDVDDVETGITQAGSVTILFGPNGYRNKTLMGLFAKSGFGSALALGDVDGDSHSDIIIGAPKDDDLDNKLTDAGSVTVISGNGYSGLNKFYGTTVKAYAGTSVACGHIDAVSGMEIIIGSPNESGFGSMKAYNIDGSKLLDKSGEKPKGYFGKSVASGDVNKDGFDDVLVGAPRYDNGKLKNAGAVILVSGDTGSVLNTQFSTAAGAGFGSSVAIGDVDGDGKGDLIAGATKDDKPAMPKLIKDTGSVSVWSGNNFALITTVYGDNKSDRFGAAISSGDINSDGKADLIIGIPGKDVPDAKVQKDAGAVKVLSGAGL